MAVTQYMGLTLPVVSSTIGPTWAQLLNQALALIDSHTHVSGQGQQIPTAAISVNADLPLNSFNATLLRSARFVSQSSTLTGASDANCVYVSGGNLYFANGSAQSVQITSGAALSASSLGGISGLSAPASAAFSSSTGTFTWQSNTNKAAVMDCGPLTVRDTATSALGIGIVSPVGIGANYTLTLPSALPASSGLLGFSNTGVLAAFATVSGTNLSVSGNLTAGATAGPTSGGSPFLSIMNTSGQSNFYMQDGRGSVGNKLGRIIYDGGVSLTAAGWAFQNVDDSGAFVSNGLILSRNGLLQLGSQSGPLQPTSLWTAITANANWTAAGSLAYWKGATGIVRLKGQATANALAGSSAAFTLPAGFRPTSTRRFVISDTTSTGFLLCQVSPTGDVSCPAGVANGNALVVDGISFLAEQ